MASSLSSFAFSPCSPCSPWFVWIVFMRAASPVGEYNGPHGRPRPNPLCAGVAMSNHSRRRFLQTAAALGTAAAIPALGEAAAVRQDPDPFGGFYVGVQSYSYRRFTLEKALGEIQS